MKRSIVILSLIFILSGCVGNQLVTHRFKSVVWNTSPPKELISLHVIAFDPPSTATPAEPAILSLSDRGQASYIDAVKNSSDLLQMIAKPFPKKKANGLDDRTKIKKSIVLSVMKTDALLFTDGDPITEADRIAKIELRLTRGDTWYRLQSWDKLGTVYGVIDLGKVMRESSGSFNAKLSPTLSGTIVGAGEIGAGKNTKINEELMLKARHIDVSGTLTPAEGIIIQHGGIGRDLEGNVSVVLSVKIDGSNVNLVKMGQLFDDNGTLQKPEDITPKIIKTRIPYRLDRAKDVKLDVSADYIFRHVTKGKESIIEGDDVVTLYKGTVTKQESLVLLTEAEYIQLSEYYLIKDINGKEPVHISSVSKKYNLAFASRDEWNELKKWLSKIDKKQFPISMGKGANSWVLTYKGRQLEKEDVSNLGAYPEFRVKK